MLADAPVGIQENAISIFFSPNAFGKTLAPKMQITKLKLAG